MVEKMKPSNRPIYWVKVYIEMLDDLKIGQLSVNLKWRFIETVLLAGDYRRDGLLPDVATMAWRLRCSVDLLKNDLGQLMAAGLLTIIPQPAGEPTWVVTKFEERQAASSNAARMRQYRARKRSEALDAAAPPLESPKINKNQKSQKTDPDPDAYSDATGDTAVTVTPVTLRNAGPSEAAPKPYEGDMWAPIDHGSSQNGTGGDVGRLVAFWEAQTGAVRPGYADTFEDQWLAPFRLLLARVENQGQARALLTAAREKMLAEGKTPYRPAAVVPAVFAQLDGLGSKPASKPDGPDALAETITKELQKYEESKS